MFEVTATSNVWLDEVKKICRLVKMHNPSALIKITETDIVEFAKILQNKYSEQIIKIASQEIMDTYADSDLTLGKFQQVCQALSTSLENENKTQPYLVFNEVSKDAAKENIAKIKEMIINAKIIKQLPYDQNIRTKEFHFTDAKSLKKHELPPYAACNFDMPIWEKTCYSDGPSLYAKCVAVDHILPYEAVQEPELRELYKKAWTMGLDKDEKARFNDLAIQYGYITPARKII